MKQWPILTPDRLARALAPMAVLWSRSLRIRQEGWEKVLKAREQGSVVFALWHDELFVPCCYHRNERILAVVSPSRDGEILAQVMANLGYRLARGSSRREGLRALRSAVRTMEATGSDAVLTVDGPKGPRHQVKEGAVYLAHRMGAQLCPVRVVISRSKRFKRAWDRFQLPLPGAECRILYDRPYAVQAERLRSDGLERERIRLQLALDTLIARPP